MWPLMLDMNKAESLNMLKSLEKEAYSCLVSALRAQGSLNQDKLRLLKDLSLVLNISQTSHKAEIRRAVNDEKLRTIAYVMTGIESTDEWAMEGRRIVPLIARSSPQTAYSAIADDVADTANFTNEQLPYPAQTERKRPAPLQPSSTESSKNQQFRGAADASPKHSTSDDGFPGKKRKVSFCEPSSLAQHLMGPPKISRIQQIYRQKTKAKLKEQQQQQEHHKMKQQHETQNKTKRLSSPNEKDEARLSPVPGCSNEHSPKFRTHRAIGRTPPSPPQIAEAELQQQQKSSKVCTSRRQPLPKTSQGQKLIIVSNSQTITSPSILQRSLTVPFIKNLNIKSLDKVKIITTSSQVITSSSTSNSVTTSVLSKPKMVTMRTNATTKKLNIPILQGVQLQALNNKGSVKMMPVSGKILTKSNKMNTNPIYFMNAVGNIESYTKPTSIDDAGDSKPALLLKNADAKFASTVNDVEKQNVTERKSSVLAEILRASGVITTDDADSETLSDQDIETQISQLTEIPQHKADDTVAKRKSRPVVNKSCRNERRRKAVVAEVRNDIDVDDDREECIVEMQRTVNEHDHFLEEGTDYVILDDDPDVVLCQLENRTDDASNILDLIETLDPETGQYSIKTTTNLGMDGGNDDEEYTVIVHQNTELDLPAISMQD